MFTFHLHTYMGCVPIFFLDSQCASVRLLGLEWTGDYSDGDDVFSVTALALALFYAAARSARSHNEIRRRPRVAAETLGMRWNGGLGDLSCQDKLGVSVNRQRYAIHENISECILHWPIAKVRSVSNGMTTTHTQDNNVLYTRKHVSY